LQNLITSSIEKEYKILAELAMAPTATDLQSVSSASSNDEDNEVEEVVFWIMVRHGRFGGAKGEGD